MRTHKMPTLAVLSKASGTENTSETHHGPTSLPGQIVYVISAVIADLYEMLPRTFFGRHYGQQILRAGTAAAANYAEVRAAESRNDFIHKLGIVRKKLCECLVWLRLIARKHLVPTAILEPIRDECDHLVRIVSASKITAKRNARLGKKKRRG